MSRGYHLAYGEGQDRTKPVLVQKSGALDAFDENDYCKNRFIKEVLVWRGEEDAGDFRGNELVEDMTALNALEGKSWTFLAIDKT